MGKRIFSTSLVLVWTLVGCSGHPVQPWEREYLAQPEMAWETGLVDEAGIRDHTYVSKEASSGGAVLGGGGCGCN